VSTFVVFEVLVRPLLNRLLGLHYRPHQVEARLAQAVNGAMRSAWSIAPFAWRAG